MDTQQVQPVPHK